MCFWLKSHGLFLGKPFASTDASSGVMVLCAGHWLQPVPQMPRLADLRSRSSPQKETSRAICRFMWEYMSVCVCVFERSIIGSERCGPFAQLPWLAWKDISCLFQRTTGFSSRVTMLLGLGLALPKRSEALFCRAFSPSPRKVANRTTFWT